MGFRLDFQEITLNCTKIMILAIVRNEAFQFQRREDKEGVCGRKSRDLVRTYLQSKPVSPPRFPFQATGPLSPATGCLEEPCGTVVEGLAQKGNTHNCLLTIRCQAPRISSLHPHEKL